MSDEEYDPTKSESEEEEAKADSEPEEVQERKVFAPPQQVAPTPAQQSEAQLAMQKRREAPLQEGLDEYSREVLKKNRKIREGQEEEIQEMREKRERRKAERQAEESRLTAMRAEEEARRKADEKERQRKKEEEELKRREERAAKMAETEKWKNPPRPNFVITKKALESSELTSTTTGADAAQKSKEQAEAEKRAILGQRVTALNTESMDVAALQEKAKELHNLIFRLEGDKYDLETRHKKGQYDMVELADRARQMSKGGKSKAVRADTGDVDPIQERYSGAPPKISLCSKYERRKDKRSYDERHERFCGPQYVYPVDRVAPGKMVVWGDNGPEYTADPNASAQEQPPPPAPKPKPQAPPAEAPAEEQAA